MVQNQFEMTALRKLLDVEASESVYAPGLNFEEMCNADLFPRGQVILPLFYFNYQDCIIMPDPCYRELHKCLRSSLAVITPGRARLAPVIIGRERVCGAAISLIRS